MICKRFKKIKERVITAEKNIHIRERHEKQMKYNYAIFLVLFLGGGIYIGKEFLTFIQGSILTIVFLLWYLFLQSIQTENNNYTDKLIRDQDSKKTSKRKSK